MLPLKKQWAVLRTLKPQTVFLLDCGSASCLPGHVKWILIHAVALKLSFSSLKKKCLLLQPVTSRTAHVISSVVLGRKCISDGCQRHCYNSIQVSSSRNFFRVTGFDSFSHDHYFIRKYMSSRRSRRRVV